MLSGECPYCDATWSLFINLAAEPSEFYAALCDCGMVFWIELRPFGVTRSHEVFVEEIAEPRGDTEKVNAIANHRRRSGYTIQAEGSA